MNKKEFERFLNSNLKDLPLEKVEQELLKMQKVWLPQILENRLKGKLKCNKCGKYSKEQTFKIESETKIVTETTYIDAGYGDDDMVGEVEYLYFYRVCQICGDKTVKNKMYLRTIKEYKKYC